MKRSTKIAVAGALAAALVIGLVLAFVPRDSRTSGVTGVFDLGPGSEIAGATMGIDGGTIQVQDETSALIGMTITVPQGAYTEPVDFAVSEAAIVSSTFGEDFTPVTPLIGVDNGDVFADELIEITIPIDIEDDEFAMGFYYDAQTGTLEGIPFSELTNDSITLVTRHFCDLAILRVKEGRLQGRITSGIDSGFRPGKDDFDTRNFGSIIAPYGHCRGQNMAEIYYYLYLKAANGQLHGLLDNDGFKPSTSQLWHDDARAIRLSSALQRLYVYAKQDAKTLADDEYWEFYLNGTDEQTFYALAYSIMASGRPQLLSIKSKAGNHSLIAYRVEGDTVYVADPNFTGAEKKVTLYRGPLSWSDQRVAFWPYYSAQNAAQAQTSGETPYDAFEWLGTSALCNFYETGLMWQSTLGDGGVVDALFPADPEIIVCRGMKEDPLYGAVFDEVPISDGLTVYLSMLDELAVNGGGRLYFRYTSPEVTARQKLLFYLNGKFEEGLIQPGMPEGYRYIELRPGENKLGVLYAIWNTDTAYKPSDPKSVDRSEYEYANWYRYTIYYDNQTTEVTEPLADGDEAALFEGTWQFYQGELLHIQGSGETMSYVNSLFSTYAGQPTFSGGPSYSSLEDYIQQVNADYSHELVSMERQYLVIEKNADGSGRADYYHAFPGNPEMYQTTFEDVQVSGDTITFFNQADSGRFGFELSLDGETLTGTRIEGFAHPYAGFDITWEQTDDPDQSWSGGYASQSGAPTGYDAEEVWSCELVKVSNR